MNISFENIKSLTIVVLIIVIVLLRECGDGCNKHQPLPGTNTVISTKVVTKYDTIKSTSISYVPKVISKTAFKVDTFILDKTLKIDTAAILTDYYSKYYYSDKIKIDSFGDITINDSVSKNAIFCREVKKNIIIPTTTITKEVLVNKREFYVGLGASTELKPFNLNYIGAEALYKTKKQQMYGLGFGINQNLKFVLSARIYWKISK